MSLITRTVLADRSNYGGQRATSSIKYIVIHYTGNDGDSDEGNLNYYKSPNREASANYFVDDDSISICVPDNFVAWHCGGTLWKDVATTGGGKLYKIVTNSNSIGIEVCDTVKDGKYMISAKTRVNLVNLVKYLMTKYDIDIDHVVRHFDVTGKYCPRYWCPPYGSNADWLKFKQDVAGSLSGFPEKQADKPVTPVTTPVVKPVTASPVVSNVRDIADYKVKVNCDCLYIRSGPGTANSIVGAIKDHGVYTITHVNNIQNWGKLKSGKGWIHLGYTTKL